MSRDHRAQQTLRWGDSETVKLVTAGGPGPFIQTNSRQLVQAHWPHPITWNVLLIGQPLMMADETGTLIVQWSVTVGEGQSQTTVPFPLSGTPINGASPATGLFAEGMLWAGPSALAPLGPFGTPIYTSLAAEISISAQDLQISALALNGVLSTHGTDYLTLAAFAAPITEPHVLQEMLEAMGGGGEQGLRWMPAGPHGPSHGHPGTGIAFPVNPDPLKYQR